MLKMILPAVFAALFFCGCCNIDYQGKSLPKLDSLTRVKCYYAQEQIPAKDVKEMKVLGELTAKAGTNWTAREMELKIRKFAQDNGANGVLILSIDRIPAGEARQDQVKNTTAVHWDTADDSAASNAYFDTSLTNYKITPTKEEEVYRTVIKARLLSLPVSDDEEEL